MKQTGTNYALAVSLVVGSLILALGFNKALTEFKSLERSVVVKGLSQREVKADILILPITFTRAHNVLLTLYQELEQDKQDILDFLKQQGFSEEEITFSAPTVTDRLGQLYGDQQVTYRYIGTGNLLIYTKNVDLGKKALEKISELGQKGIITRVEDHEVEYIYTQLNSIKPAMIEEATLNARETAMKFAQDSQSDLGKIKQASQGQFSITNRDRNTPYIKTVRVVSTIEYYLKD